MFSFSYNSQHAQPDGIACDDDTVEASFLDAQPRRTPCRRTRDNQGRRSPQGVVVLELILVLPVLIVMLLAVVQFAMFFRNMQQVAHACRVGALTASESSAATLGAATVPAEVLDSINKQLGSSGISYCRVRLEHNTGGGVVMVTENPAMPCDCGPDSSLSSPPVSGSEYVRLSICVQLAELMPNCLATFGFDVSDPSKVAECTTVLRHEP